MEASTVGVPVWHLPCPAVGIFLQRPGPEIIGSSGVLFSLENAFWRGEKILVGAARMNELFATFKCIGCLVIVDTQGFRVIRNLKTRKYLAVWTSI